MSRPRSPVNKNIETAVNELLDSRAESRIYVYLLRKNGARSDEIIRGTKLHPSTVRELLSKMYNNKIIYREKIRTETIGKNPTSPTVRFLRARNAATIHTPAIAIARNVYQE